MLNLKRFFGHGIIIYVVLLIARYSYQRFFVYHLYKIRKRFYIQIHDITTRGVYLARPSISPLGLKCITYLRVSLSVFHIHKLFKLVIG